MHSLENYVNVNVDWTEVLGSRMVAVHANSVLTIIMNYCVKLAVCKASCVEQAVCEAGCAEQALCKAKYVE